MMYRQDQESPAPLALRHHRDEAGIGRAVVVVVDAPGDEHALVALPLGGRLPENVAELGAAERRTPRHLEGQEVDLSLVLISGGM